MTKTSGPPSPMQVADLVKTFTDQPALSGSPSGEFTAVLVNQVAGAIFQGSNPDIAMVGAMQQAAFTAMHGVAPSNPVEGMLAAQLVATHSAAMDCYRRAVIPEQTFEGRRMALGFANKLVRSYAVLLEALDRHRGKGQPQVVRVERVTVEAGGQAIVGAVTQGGGVHNESEDRPHALAHAPEPEMRRPDPPRQPVPLTSGEGQAAVPNARRGHRQRRAAG